MSSTLYCLRFYQNDDDGVFTLDAVSSAMSEGRIEFQVLELICEQFEGMANSYHAHFTWPLTADSKKALTSEARRLNFDADVLLSFCTAAINSNSEGDEHAYQFN